MGLDIVSASFNMNAMIQHACSIYYNNAKHKK